MAAQRPPDGAAWEGQSAVILNGVMIEDTFAEAFPMRATRMLITADEPRWARTAAEAMTGFATSVIACGCEAGIERELAPEETPDGRPGDRRPAVRDGRARTWPSSSWRASASAC